MTAFLAPRPPSLDFFGPEALVTELVIVEEDVEREDFGVGRLLFVVEVDRIDEDVTVRGVLFWGGVLRPMTGGETKVDIGGLGVGSAGLSHEEKKSSSSLATDLLSADGVIVSMPST